MAYKVTVLRGRCHGEFLAAQRQDPVTRRVFAAGDRVTLCAACLLPFLVESWDGVGGTHCGQTATVGLEAFEAAPAVGVDNPGSGDADGSPTAEPDAETSGSAIGLRPVPCKLHEVPVRLRRS